jgi:hypothetical protein
MFLPKERPKTGPMAISVAIVVLASSFAMAQKHGKPDGAPTKTILRSDRVH